MCPRKNHCGCSAQFFATDSLWRSQPLLKQNATLSVAPGLDRVCIFFLVSAECTLGYVYPRVSWRFFFFGNTAAVEPGFKYRDKIRKLLHMLQVQRRLHHCRQHHAALKRCFSTTAGAGNAPGSAGAAVADAARGTSNPPSHPFPVLLFSMLTQRATTLRTFCASLHACMYRYPTFVRCGSCYRLCVEECRVSVFSNVYVWCGHCSMCGGHCSRFCSITYYTFFHAGVRNSDTAVRVTLQVDMPCTSRKRDTAWGL